MRAECADAVFVLCHNGIVNDVMFITSKPHRTLRSTQNDRFGGSRSPRSPVQWSFKALQTS